MGQITSKRRSRKSGLAAPFGYIYGPAFPQNLNHSYASHQPPVIPPGFVPQTGYVPNYTQMQAPTQMPIPQSQPYLWPVQHGTTKKRRTTRRRRGRKTHEPPIIGRAPVQNMPEPETSFPLPQTEDPPDTFPSSLAGFGMPSVQPPIRRIQTPYHHPQALAPDDEDTSSTDDSSQQQQQQQQLPGPMPEPVNDSFPPRVYPHDPDPGRVPSRLSQRMPPIARTSAQVHPLPALPPNILDLPENREMIEKLTTTPDILNGLTAYVRTEIPTAPPPAPEQQSRMKKSKKNLFRLFSKKKLPELPTHRSVVMPVQPRRAVPDVPREVRRDMDTGGPSMQREVTHLETTPVIPNPSLFHGAPGSYILFNQDTEHAGLLNHSPFRVRYQGVDYPTALHLLEALKFLPHRPDIADHIRTCEDVEDVYPLVNDYAEEVGREWSSRFLDELEMVVYLKVTQHANLRDLLMSTGNTHLVYDDPSDAYWGCGSEGEGDNVLGTVLERVRANLMPGSPS